MDEFFTKSDIVEYCLSKLNLNVYNLIVEPSAGDGAFVRELVKTTPQKLYFDINPQHAAIQKQDFLEWNQWPLINDILVVGNPPFGKNANLAIKFFNHASRFASTIAFILPRTFNKKSVHNKLNLNFHLVHTEVLPKDSFLYKGKSYDVPCCFQIWVKENHVRGKDKIEPLKNFKYTIREDAEFAIRRVGFYAGRVVLNNPHTVNQNTHYYLKILKKELSKEIVFESLQKYDFSFVHETVGSRSLSKLELNPILNKLFP